MIKSSFIIGIIYASYLLIINHLNAQTIYCGGGNTYGTTTYNNIDYYYIYLSSSYRSITISTCGSSYDTLVYFYDTSNSLLDSQDDGNGGVCSDSSNEYWTYYPSAGYFSSGTYRIGVGGYGGAYGSYTLSVTCSSSYPSVPTYRYTPSPTPYSYCPSYEYECSYESRCIPTSWVCDDYDDCNYGDDEDNCYTTSASSSTTTWIVIVVVFIVISCIGYVVWYQNNQKKKARDRVVAANAKANVSPSPAAKPAPAVVQPSANIKFVDQNGNTVAPPTAGTPGIITGNAITPGTTPGPNIKYVDANGNPVAPPIAGGNIKFVDQNGNPVAAPTANPNIKFVDQWGNPVAPPTNQGQIIQPAPTINYVDINGNPVAPPTVTPQQVSPSPQPPQIQPQPVEAPPPGYSQPGENNAPPAYAEVVEEAAPPPAYSNVMGDTAGGPPPAYQE